MWWSDRRAPTAARRTGLAALLVVALLGGPAACGFQPLYGTKATRDRAVADLSSVAIEPIPDRVGQLVRNNLIDRMHTRGGDRYPKYRLRVTLSTASEGLAVRSDDVVTRRNLTMTADYKILSADAKSLLFEGRTFAVAAYNIGDSEYANLAAQQDAYARTAREVSEEIKNQVVYFVRINGSR